MDAGSGGWKPVVQEHFHYHPNEVFVNGNKDDRCRQTCDLTPGRNDVIIKFNDQLTSCNQMFQSINEILEVDLSYFDASQVLDMGHMFHGCTNLAKVNFGDNIDTSKVTNMGQFFEHCHTLTSINLSKLNTAQVTSMESAFNSCYNLKTVDLSHLNTARVKNMMWMFYDCYNLESVNLRNIDTSSVEYTVNMFFQCYNLKSIDLSYLDFSRVISWKICFIDAPI